MGSLHVTLCLKHRILELFLYLLLDLSPGKFHCAYVCVWGERGCEFSGVCWHHSMRLIVFITSVFCYLLTEVKINLLP